MKAEYKQIISSFECNLAYLFCTGSVENSIIFFIEYAINSRTGNVKDLHKIMSIYYDAMNPQNYYV